MRCCSSSFPVSGVCAALVAVRQVLPSLQLLPEDVPVERVEGHLVFTDKEISGSVPQGTVLLQVESNAAEDLPLFVSAGGQLQEIDRVQAKDGPVYCSYRALRVCYSKHRTGRRYLSSGEKVATPNGADLLYIILPAAGCIFARASVERASRWLHAGCKSSGTPVVSPRQYDSVSLSFAKKAEGSLELCFVAPPVGNSKQQVVALLQGFRAPKIFCEEASKKLFYWEDSVPAGSDLWAAARPGDLALSGAPAKCDSLEDGTEHLLSVQVTEEQGAPPAELTFSYATIQGARHILPVQIETFATSDLGPACSTQSLLLIYQPNYALHTEVEHGAIVECHKIKRVPLASIEREALMMELPSKNVWIEVPAGTLLAAPDAEAREGILKLFAYQPSFDSSDKLKMTPLYAFEDGKAVGQAALSTNQEANDPGFIYQTRDGGQNFFLGCLTPQGFVSGGALEFSTDPSANVEYRLTVLQRGSSLALTARNATNYLEPSLLNEGKAKYFHFRELSSAGRRLEEELSLLHRLRHHLSSQGSNGLFITGSKQGNSATTCCSIELRRVSSKCVCATGSGLLSVVLRLPVHMRDSPTSRGLIQQLHVAVSLLAEKVVDKHPAVSNRLTLYGTALKTLHKILGAGHCNKCTTDKANCSFCRAVMFRDFVIVDINGLDISPETMPASGSWGPYRGQDFLLSADTSFGPVLIGVDFDFHAHKALQDTSPSPKHLSHLRGYANSCLNAHIASMVSKEKHNASFCPALNNYMKAILTVLHIGDFAALMNDNEFRSLILEGCSVRVEDAVASCMEGDGEMLAIQRLPEFRGLGRSALYDYVRSLLFPVGLKDIAADLASAASSLPGLERASTAAPTLSAFLSQLASQAQTDGGQPVVDLLARGEKANAASDINAALDSAVAAKGIRPSRGAAFYVGLWSHPSKATEYLEDILGGTQAAASGPEQAEDDTSEKLQKVQTYCTKLRRQNPQQFAAILFILKWPKDKIPETLEEAQRFIEAAKGIVVVPGEIDNMFTPSLHAEWGSVSHEVLRHVPERHVAEDVVPFIKRISAATPEVYGQICAHLGWGTPRLPTTAEEAQASTSALQEMRARTKPIEKWLRDLGEPLTPTMTWSHIRAVLDKAHGPHSKVPFFIPSSEKCQCVRSTGRHRCYIDALKTTDDVLFRLTLLVPAAVAEFISPDSKALTTEAASFCTATGVFISAWQQHQVEAGFEHPNGRQAHLVLIERLKNAKDYLLAEINEAGVEDVADHNARKRALKRFFSGICVPELLSVNAGAKVAREPAGIQGAKVASRSLYGGIANTVGASAAQVDQFVQTMLSLGSSASGSRKKTHPLTGLIAALRVSQRFKDCFSQSKDMTSRAWYLMHIEGEAIVRRLQQHRLGEQVASSTYKLASPSAARAFDKAFKTLMVTVTTQWEDSNAFRHLRTYTVGGKHVGVPETPPEDFDTSADAHTVVVGELHN
ncbi:hypothetical protein Efla_004568 [Eimeria flavescens]